MKFDCKEISISDEEIGCQVIFSEFPDLGATTENRTIKEMEESIGKYILFQRFFPEEDNDPDTSYFETNDETLCGNIEDFKIALSTRSLKLTIDKETIEVTINPTNYEYSELKRVLPIIINNHGELLIEG
jgi:hypothetical protein